MTCICLYNFRLKRIISGMMVLSDSIKTKTYALNPKAHAWSTFVYSSGCTITHKNDYDVEKNRNYAPLTFPEVNRWCPKPRSCSIPSRQAATPSKNERSFSSFSMAFLGGTPQAGPFFRVLFSIPASAGFPFLPLSSGVLTVAPCACCVNLYVCMYNVSILRVFPYFYHCITLLVFSCLCCFCFLIKSYLTAQQNGFLEACNTSRRVD
jgi:hypothetical protein